MRTPATTNQPILFRTVSEYRLYTDVRVLFILSGALFGVSLFFLILALIASGGNVRALIEARAPTPTACLMAGLFFFLIAFLFFLFSRRQRSFVSGVLMHNAVRVYEGHFVGRCMGLSPQEGPVSFDLPFPAVTRVTVEEERVGLLVRQRCVAVLCLHTEARVYRLYGIADTESACRHLSYFLENNS